MLSATAKTTVVALTAAIVTEVVVHLVVLDVVGVAAVVVITNLAAPNVVLRVIVALPLAHQRNPLTEVHRQSVNAAPLQKKARQRSVAESAVQALAARMEAIRAVHLPMRRVTRAIELNKHALYFHFDFFFLC